jgi:ketosteroid isomerase-like protein
VTGDEARRVLARLHEAQAAFYAGGPREPLHEVLTEDIVWVVPGRNAIAGEYHGLDAVVDYFTRRRDERVAACWLLPLDPAAFDAIWSGPRG